MVDVELFATFSLLSQRRWKANKVTKSKNVININLSFVYLHLTNYS